MEMTTLPKEADLEQLLSSEPIVLLQFTSPSCPPCTAIRQRITAWGQKKSGFQAYAVPIEDFPTLCGQLGVFTVPTILVYVESRLTLRESGYFSLDDLLQRVERYRALCLEE